MPRGGPPSHTYSLPAVYLAVPGTTILATQHNSPLEDIADVLNEAWPINLGGTGGTSLITSWDSLNSRGDDIPTGASVDLDASTGANIHFTGNTTVTSISLSNGRVRVVVPNSAFSITASASLFVNGATSGSYSIPAGAQITFVGGSAGVVYVATPSVASSTLFGYTTTATAAGTTTLTVSSTYQQYFTGTTTQTVVMPVASTLALGQSWRIVNNSTGALTINSSGSNLILTMQAGTAAIITCILTSGTSAASWSVQYTPATVNANSTTLTISSQDTGATAEPTLVLDRNSASPATNDLLGPIIRRGRSSTGVSRDYAFDRVTIVDATNASEDATYEQGVIIAGAARYFYILGALASGTADANAFGLPRGQLSFPATANPSSDPNTLDDYEEGSFTPAMTFGGSASGITYDTQFGRYTKIGREVFFYIFLDLSNNGSGTGAAVVTGLPFTSALGVGGGCTMMNWSNFSGVVGTPVGLVDVNATTISLNMSGAAASAAMTDTNITNTATFTLVGSYTASA